MTPELLGMLKAFNDLTSTKLKGFLKAMFRTPKRNVLKTTKCVIDMVRHGKKVAADVIRGTGGNRNERSKFTRKKYEIPAYNEYVILTAKDLEESMPGEDTFNPLDPDVKLTALMVEDQFVMAQKIDRAIELQARDGLFFGKIVLHNGDIVDFKMKPSHKPTIAIPWSDPTATALQDIKSMCAENRKDGRKKSDLLCLGADGWDELINSQKFKDLLDTKRIDLGEIRPVKGADDVYTVQGVLNLGDDKVTIVTSSSDYDTEAEKGIPYIPRDMIWVGNSGARFDLIYGAVDLMKKAPTALQRIGLSHVPTLVPGKMVPYGEANLTECTILVGVKCAPLCIPTEIDTFSAAKVI